MPARLEEVRHAKEEGVEFLTLCNPIECLTDAKLPGTVSLRTVEMAISYVSKAQRWHWRRWRWQQAQLR